MNSALVKEIRSARKKMSEGGGDGCPRCRGIMITMRDAISGEFRRAEWNGKELSEEEHKERQEEQRCSGCGRDLTRDQTINIGGSFAPPIYGRGLK